MATFTQNIHPTGGVQSASVTVKGYNDFYVVALYVGDTEPGTSDVAVFCWNRDEVDTIMRGMAAAVRQWFGKSEPEPDYDAIAAEMA
jgi:hypothetical protein